MALIKGEEKTRHYETLSQIGSGAYGVVYKARDKKNNNPVAMKKLNIRLSDDGGVPTSTLREIALLKQVNEYEHPNVVRLLDVCYGERLPRQNIMSLFLVFEHLDQDMSNLIANGNKIEPDKIKYLMYQLLSGIEFLHSHRIIHRDLKPQNILLNKNLLLKLADFGLAKVYEVDMALTTVVVTLWYRAPEVLLSTAYNSTLDLWSSACIMAELFNLSPLFPGSSEGDQLNKIFTVIGRPTEEEWPSRTVLLSSFQEHVKQDLKAVVPDICDLGKQLLASMLTFNPCDRISASECLKHPYFSQFGYEPQIWKTSYSTREDGDHS